ncbi:carboxymuconolactone decarboxylase family protein [Nocardia sp. NPDC059091]|uniref:carboxymuconolactone decarboxylase family protein n=1 Tax=unclassified Nocardia TaxID=2637762 RepID=UPI0036A52910
MNERFRRGAACQTELGGSGGVRGRVYDELADIAPDLHRFAVEFAYGDIHSRPGLDAGRRELVILGALIALGDTRPQLEAHLGAALNAGVAPGEIVEAILQALPYAGFPRVLSAMSAARGVLAGRDLLPVTTDSIAQ